jgi:tetratricopeptide (TPR) repeat protein
MIENAKTAYEERDFAKALEIYLDHYEKEHQNLDVLQGLARTYFQLQKYEDAVLFCNRALELNKTIAWPHLVLSYINFNLKNMPTSKNEAMLALQFAPDEWETNYWLGTILNLENKVDDALPFLEKAVIIESNNEYIYKSLSLAYLKKRNLKKYYEALEQMNKIKPNLLLNLSIQVGRRATYLVVLFLLAQYFFIALSIITSTKILLIAPAILDVVWVASGVIVFGRQKIVGIVWILLGLIHGLIVLLVFTTFQ